MKPLITLRLVSKQASFGTYSGVLKSETTNGNAFILHLSFCFGRGHKLLFFFLAFFRPHVFLKHITGVFSPLIVCSVCSAEGYKTIHHLCTTPASQVVPVELQLASRICHTQNLITATAQFNQQRTALGHISHPDTQRYTTIYSSVSFRMLLIKTHSL